ncbi:hypothetical protein BOTBODRAFT_180634 [Botryobasidium botryosum FD-172 SS1]|uniref:Uncharacterized protein n=1 Tax=Botryobasidium botryosum (strain FD-172 SS1) TaxID=930990 RepID=A0A067LW06_BOTB1|nr:hypothetical protein BOTBODRAFT_180634 [Botryobasidium botryosum FD-172 SS1]
MGVHILIRTSESPPPDEDVRREARRLIQATDASVNWITPSPIVHSQPGARNSAYTLAQPPPKICTSAKRSSFCDMLEEWGAPLAPKEVSELDKLDEFVGTQLQYLADFHSKLSMAKVLASNDVDNDGPPSKKRRKIDHGDSHSSVRILLGDLVPLPHYYASPHGPTELDARVQGIREHAIHAILDPSAPARLSTPFARSIWIIPVFGHGFLASRSTPSTSEEMSHAYADLSPAQILPGLPLLSPTKAPASKSVTIAWTNSSLRTFWDLLLNTQKHGLFGSIGISFESTQSRTRSSKFIPYPSDTEGEKPARTHALYIKLYHDARCAMRLRSLLDSYKEDAILRPSSSLASIQPNVSNASIHDVSVSRAPSLPVMSSGKSAKDARPSQAQKKKILRGAKLMLVDELGEPLLIS